MILRLNEVKSPFSCAKIINGYVCTHRKLCLAWKWLDLHQTSRPLTLSPLQTISKNVPSLSLSLSLPTPLQKQWKVAKCKSTHWNCILNNWSSFSRLKVLTFNYKMWTFLKVKSKWAVGETGRGKEKKGGQANCKILQLGEGHAT